MRPSDADIQARLSRTIQNWFPEEYAKDYNTEQRRQLAKEGKCKPDLSFPIVDTEDVKNAVKLARSPSDRAWVKKRAAALGASKMIPETWAALSGQTLTTEQAELAAGGMVPCPTCQGRGEIEGGTMVGPMKCPTCKGAGMVERE